MKRLICGTLILLTNVAFAWAEEPAAEQSQLRLKAEAQHMVSLGVSEDAAAKLQNQFQDAQMVRARTIVQAAKQADLPIDPLVDKALEGLAKQVAPDRVLNAMEQVRGRYATARDEAREITPRRTRQKALTRVMAQTMTAGMPPQEVTAIADQVRSRKRTMTRDECENLSETTFEAARDMVRMGARSRVVSETLMMALSNDYTIEQMRRVRNQFMLQAQQTEPDQLALQFRERVRAGQDVGQENGGGNGSGSGGSGTSSGNGNGNGGSGSGSGSDGGSGSGSGSGSGGGSGSNSGSGSGSGSGSDGGSGSGSGSGSDGGSGSGGGKS